MFTLPAVVATITLEESRSVFEGYWEAQAPQKLPRRAKGRGSLLHTLLVLLSHT
jgi:hypothetical protein